MPTKEESSGCEIHCVHLIALLTLMLLPILHVNTLQQEKLFASWESRKMNTTELVQPGVAYCEGALETVFLAEQRRPMQTLMEIFRGNLDVMEVITSMAIKALDAPWWYNLQTGPEHPCTRLLVMAWDLVGFPDVNGTMAQMAGLDCDGVCGGRSLDVLGLDFALAGFPLIWDLDHLGATVETANLDYYRVADNLVYILPISMLLSAVYWLCNRKTKIFMYAYALVWAVLFALLLVPLPAFVIAKVDPLVSTDTENHLTSMIVFSENDERVDYYLYLQWLFNAVINIGSALTFQYPYIILVGGFAIFFAITDSLQEVGDDDVHTISSIMEVLITGAVAFLLIFLVSILATLRPSMEQSIREEAWVYFDEDFGDPFITMIVVGYVVAGFLFMYLNFLFDRLYAWYEVVTYFYFRVICIIASIYCMISATEEVQFNTTDLVPTSYFVYVVLAVFVYNFICGRFIFFIFYRPHLVDDPKFGWYRVACGGKYGLTVERLFEVSKPKETEDKAGEEKAGFSDVEMYGRKIPQPTRNSLDVRHVRNHSRYSGDGGWTREYEGYEEQYEKHISPTLQYSPPPPPIPLSSRDAPWRDARLDFEMPVYQKRIPRTSSRGRSPGRSPRPSPRRSPRPSPRRSPRPSPRRSPGRSPYSRRSPNPSPRRDQDFYDTRL